MIRSALAVALLLVGSLVHADICPVCGKCHNCGRVSASYVSSGHATMAPVQAVSSTQAIVNQKADRMAATGFKGHVLRGIGLGIGRFEGCGWGPTPQGAYNACCYSGNPGTTGPRKQEIASAIRRGRDGMYYAVRIYR